MQERARELPRLHDVPSINTFPYLAGKVIGGAERPQIPASAPGEMQDVGGILVR